MAQTNTILPLPIFPSTRDMDSMNNTVKQIISFPAMAINNMLDNTNNMVKNATAQLQANMQNLPVPPLFPPFAPNMQTTQARVSPASTSAQIEPRVATSEYGRYLSETGTENILM